MPAFSAGNHSHLGNVIPCAPKTATCVCVCPTLDKGSFTTTLSTLHRQGRVALPPYHTQRSCGREWEAGPDQPCVPAVLSSCDSTLPLVCCHGGSMILPQNLPFAAFILQLSRADRSFSRLDQQLVETPTSLSDSPPCSSITFLPIGEIEFNGKPVSKCVLLSRPTRVLSVIPVTGAPILHGKATTPTHHRSLDSHRKAPTPSQNQPPHRPPGQKTVLEEYFRFQLPDLRFQHSVVFSCLPIMCEFLCLLCCCRDSFLDRTQGWALQLFSLIRYA